MAFPHSDVTVAGPGSMTQVAPPVAQPMTAPVTVKIVVAGGFAVGKTTFIGSISDIEPLSTEAAMTEHSLGVDDAGAAGLSLQLRGILRLVDLLPVLDPHVDGASRGQLAARGGQEAPGVSHVPPP